VVGIGPGDKGDITQRAIDALKKSDTVIGYKLYIDLIIDIISSKRIISSTINALFLQQCVKKWNA